MIGHGRIQCLCGKVLSQCRCMNCDKVTHTVTSCERCVKVVAGTNSADVNLTANEQSQPITISSSLADELESIISFRPSLDGDDCATIRRAIDALRAIVLTNECYRAVGGGWKCWMCDAPAALGANFKHEPQCPIRIASDGVPKEMKEEE